MKKIESFKEYQELALVTLAPPPEGHPNGQHAGMGLVTEVGEIIDTFKRHWFYGKELDLVNLQEEIGDVLWYVAVGYHSLGEGIPEEVMVDTSEEISAAFCLTKLSRHASNFFYFHERYSCEKDPLLIDLSVVLFALSKLGRLYDFSLLSCAEANIIKLQKRYPSGFSSVDALNRDTENELSHITSTQEYNINVTYDTSVEAKEAWVEEGSPAGELGRPAKRITKKKPVKETK